MQTMSKGNPQLVTVHDPSHAFEGYTLFAPWGGKSAWLVDMQGRFVHRWTMPNIPGENCVLLPNGHLLYSGKDLDGPVMIGGAGGWLYEADWDGNIVWQHRDPYMHHDFYRMDNGNTMVLRWVKVPAELVPQVQGGVPDTERDGVMWTDSFQEIAPDGEVVWEWLAYEHLDPAVDVICPLCARAEWTHCNSCCVLPNGDILTTYRSTDWMLVIDKATGSVKWRWGQEELAHPHNPTMLDNGHILVFDNGNHRRLHPLNFSRVLEIDPASGEIVWEFKEKSLDDFYSSIVSGCQRLPNGNTLVCEGHFGRVFEVTSDGEKVWEFTSPFFYQHDLFGPSNQMFRAYRYGIDHPAFVGKDLSPERFRWSLWDGLQTGETLSDGLASAVEWCGWTPAE